MRKSARIVVLSVAGSVIGSATLGQTIEGRSKPEAPIIRIRVYNYAEIPDRTLHRARKQASVVLGRAGVETQWLDCLAASGTANDPACRKPPGDTDLVLYLLSRSMAEKLKIPKSPETFGYALQPARKRFGWIAGVFTHRTAELIKEANLRVDVSTVFPSVLLGHLMAHEIGHLLLGSEGHSSKGIMRARWRREDLEAAAQGRLGFTAQQARRMRDQAWERTNQERSAGTR